LNTILDFDRIALLSDGKLVEFESPKVLLSRPSVFRDLYNS
jgi:ATP-binding cassette subfamily C (CFTR/MRP) protein 1